MAYVKTVWETGDVITAEKLNNIEGGVEANAEAVAAQKDTLLITGDVIVDGSLNAQFTNVVGDAANIEDYKNVIVRAKVFTDLGGDDPIFSGIELIIPWYNNSYDADDPDTILLYEFKTAATFSNTPIEAYLHYSPASQSWTADIVPITT